MSALSWQDLFATGSVFNLTVGRWDRMGRLRPEDIGIEKTDEIRRSFTWGSMKLVPDQSIKPLWRLVAAAKMAVERYTVPFLLIRGARFVPAESKLELEKELEQLAEQLDDAISAFVETYDKAKADQRDVLELGFRDASNGNQAVVERAMGRLPSLYPDEAELRRRFYLRWQSYSLATPQDGTFDGDVLKEATDVRDALKDMLSKLREELSGRAQEIAELVLRGGKITERTYKSTRRLCDKIDRITRTFDDPTLVAASRALRIAVDDAAAFKDDKEDRDRALRGGLGEVTEILKESVEVSLKSVEQRLTGLGRRKLKVV